MSNSKQRVSRIWIVQALYYLVTGIWPFLGLKSFVALTGPKTDIWLVRCVAALVSVIGGVIAFAGLRKQIDANVVALATGASAGLTAIDLVYSARGRISKIYALDAVVNMFLIGGWIRERRGNARDAPRPGEG